MYQEDQKKASQVWQEHDASMLGSTDPSGNNSVAGANVRREQAGGEVMISAINPLYSSAEFGMRASADDLETRRVQPAGFGNQIMELHHQELDVSIQGSGAILLNNTTTTTNNNNNNNSNNIEVSKFQRYHPPHLHHDHHVDGYSRDVSEHAAYNQQAVMMSMNRQLAASSGESEHHQQCITGAADQTWPFIHC
jgi:hypothetical protein